MSLTPVTAFPENFNRFWYFGDASFNTSGTWACDDTNVVTEQDAKLKDYVESYYNVLCNMNSDGTLDGEPVSCGTDEDQKNCGVIKCTNLDISYCKDLVDIYKLDSEDSRYQETCLANIAGDACVKVITKPNRPLIPSDMEPQEDEVKIFYIGSLMANSDMSYKCDASKDKLDGYMNALCTEDGGVTFNDGKAVNCKSREDILDDAKVFCNLTECEKVPIEYCGYPFDMYVQDPFDDSKIAFVDTCRLDDVDNPTKCQSSDAAALLCAAAAAVFALFI